MGSSPAVGDLLVFRLPHAICCARDRDTLENAAPSACGAGGCRPGLCREAAGLLSKRNCGAPSQARGGKAHHLRGGAAMPGEDLRHQWREGAGLRKHAQGAGPGMLFDLLEHLAQKVRAPSSRTGSAEVAQTRSHAQQSGRHAQARRRGASSPCGQSPMDFGPVSLAARTKRHRKGAERAW